MKYDVAISTLQTIAQSNPYYVNMGWEETIPYLTKPQLEKAIMVGDVTYTTQMVWYCNDKYNAPKRIRFYRVRMPK